MKTSISALVVSLLASACFAAPSVSNVALSQGDNGIVTITYDLGGDPGIVLLDILTNGVSVGDSKITHAVGDVNRRIAPGSGKKIWWSCCKDAPEVEGTTISATVTAYSLDAPPEVLVLDLVNTNSYLFYKSLAALPDGGLANDIYRTSRLVMKKVPAKGVTFLSGRSGGSDLYKPFLATFTYDYYMGIYPVTQGQQVFLDGETHSTFTEGADAPLRPVDGVSWSDLRYFTLWPNDQGEYRHDNFVSANCILAKLSRFGLFIDLPTSTEWEYACRAGTQTRFGNGTDDEAGMAQMGWYNGNAGGTTHPVGLKEPNEWGFYDMHGNVLEWCLDQYRSSSLSDRDVVRTDYPGEATASSGYSNCKARRGGAYNRPYGESASHWFIDGQWETAKCGYRVCVKAEIP